MQHNKEGNLWIAIDSKVYDLSKFAQLHPGGLSVLLNEDVGSSYIIIFPLSHPSKPRYHDPVAGQNATEAFYSLHRQEVLTRPQYARLQIGTIKGESPRITPPVPGELSLVPYAEPSWLSQGFSSPYYSEVCVNVCDDGWI